jgi:hypothetical protein
MNTLKNVARSKGPIVVAISVAFSVAWSRCDVTIGGGTSRVEIHGTTAGSGGEEPANPAGSCTP